MRFCLAALPPAHKPRSRWAILPIIRVLRPTWSTPSQQIDEFPLATFVNFCRNHGLISVNDRPQWRTVKGGARNYVVKLAAEITDIRLSAGLTRVTRDDTGVTISSTAGDERFDQVVFACHTDQALALIADHDAPTHAILSKIPSGQHGDSAYRSAIAARP